MATQMVTNSSLFHQYPGKTSTSSPIQFHSGRAPNFDLLKWRKNRTIIIGCSAPLLRTCKNCKTQFDVSLNNPRACSYHTAHFGGETKRKFESVYSGGTMSTPDAGKVYQYWHCCGSEDPFHPGCIAAPHYSYDD